LDGEETVLSFAIASAPLESIQPAVFLMKPRRVRSDFGELSRAVEDSIIAFTPSISFGFD
jgi:hypothetical protein